MAWQLIYTSAPRSLEAGRSGFGTVARHRAITPLLVAAIERASQFSRLPGVDTGRVIYSYRIITIAGGRYHVLSSIRDAGADYTGRTNHIAHHLVAEPREIAQIGASGPSPADVLLGMHWATSWTETPRYLEAADEIPLASFSPMAGGSTWERVAGHAAQARLLASGEASRGAYVIQPAGVDLRQIFGESLRLMPDRLWQVSFTTSLQPSDEPADFRWIGIETASPLRVQTETSGRPIFNLAEPSTLPVMEVLEPATAGVVSAGSSAAVVPGATASPGLFAGGASLNASAGSPACNRAALEYSSGGTPPVFLRRFDRRTLLVISGTLLAVVLLALLVFQIILPKVHEWQAERDERAAIKAAMDATGYFNGTRGVPALDSELKNLKLADLHKMRTFVALTARMIETLNRPDFDGMRTARQEYDTFRRENPVNAPDIVARFNEVAATVGNVAQLENDLSSTNVGDQGYDAFEKLQATAGSMDKLLDDEAPDSPALKAWLDQLAAGKQANALAMLIKGASRPAQNPGWFQTAADKIKVPPGEPETRKILERVNKVITDWKFVDTQTANKSMAGLEAYLKEQAADPYWPTWLMGLAEARVKVARPGQPAGPAGAAVYPATSDTPHRRLSAEPAPTPSSLALRFVSDDKRLPVPLPTLGASLKFLLRVEGEPDEELKPFAADISKGLGPFGEYFKIVDGKLNIGAKPPAPPYAVIGKRDNAELFRIYVGAGRDDKSIFGVTDGGLKRDGDELTIDLSRLPGTVTQPLSLRLPPGFGAKGSRIAVVELHGGTCNIEPAVREAKEVLARLSGAASGDETATSDPELNSIRAEVRKLSDKPKVKGEKKTPPNRAAVVERPDDVSADVGANRPAEMLAALFEKFWDTQTGINPNPSEEVRAELAKKPEQADWGALLAKLKSDYTYANSQMDGKSQYDKPREWVAQVERLSVRVCAYETQRQILQKNTAALQARAAKAAEEAKALGGHPLLNGQIPPGVYTLLVSDDDRKLPLIDFRIP